MFSTTTAVADMKSRESERSSCCVRVFCLYLNAPRFSVVDQQLHAEYFQICVLSVDGFGVGEYARNDQVVAAFRLRCFRRRRRNHAAVLRRGHRENQSQRASSGERRWC